MSIDELIQELVKLRADLGGGAEVLGQSHGCCSHGHYITSVERGSAEDEKDCVVIRV